MEIIRGFYQGLRNKSRPLLWVGISVFVLFAVGISIVLIKREALLKKAFLQVQNKLERDYGLNLQSDAMHFEGLTTVAFEGLSLEEAGKPRLLAINDLTVRVKLLPLLYKSFESEKITIAEAQLSVFSVDSVSNYSFFYDRVFGGKGEQAAVDTQSGSKETPHYAKLMQKALNTVFSRVPDELWVNELKMDFVRDSMIQQVYVPALTFNNKRLYAEIHQDGIPSWRVDGQIQPGLKQLYIKMSAIQQQASLPFLDQEFDMKVGFDAFQFRLSQAKMTSGVLHVSGESSFSNLLVSQWRVSSEDVLLPSGQFDFDVEIGSDYAELTSKSKVKIKELTFFPTIRLDLGAAPRYKLGLTTTPIGAQEFFDAFPKGLFKSLDQIRVSGQLAYQMNAEFDTENPDSVRFHSELIPTDFRVNSWGSLTVPALNGVFVYEPEDSQRKLVVGPESASFVSFGQISTNLKNAILTTEDPSFFYHKGFVMESIREAIATNYKEKSFKRGASTLSMQLAKNLFLNRNKTIVRKLEEVLVVWLMEQSRVVSKERMFEIYLNIIEWGNEVYGIKEASAYYFEKHPSQLTVGESIYLASIVPRPKTGLYAFSYTGRLKPYLKSYFSYVGSIMAGRNLIVLDSVGDYGFEEVLLRLALRPDRPIGMDTLFVVPPVLPLEYTPDQY